MISVSIFRKSMVRSLSRVKEELGIHESVDVLSGSSESTRSVVVMVGKRSRMLYFVPSKFLLRKGILQ